MFECYLKKSTANRSRVIALFVIGGIFFILICWALWFRCLADNLAKYVPDDTVLYAHFSLPKAVKSDNFNNSILNILNDADLADFPLHQIQRELALVGQIKGDDFYLSVLFKTNDPIKIKKYLDSGEVNYYFLNSSTVLVPAKDILKNEFVKNKKNKLAQTIRGQFAKFNSLNLFLHHDLTSQFKDDLMLSSIFKSLERENQHVYLNFKVKPRYIKIYNHQKLPFLYKTEDDRNAPLKDFDLALTTDRLGEFFSGWQQMTQDDFEKDKLILERYKIFLEANYLSEGDLKSLLNKKMVFMTRKNEKQIDWVLGDNDFYLLIENYDQETELVEDVIKKVVARQFPTVTNVYLSDGSKIKELRPNIDGLNFQDGDNFKYLDTPGQNLSFYYRLQDNNLEIVNNSDLFLSEEQRYLISDNFFKVKNSYLFKIGFLKYFSFDTLELDNGVLFVR